MFKSWYDQRDEEKTEFWLEFKVVHDGLETDEASQLLGVSNSTFTCFPSLPPEIRLKIWEYLIQPRVILAACIDSRFQDEKHAQIAQRPTRPATPVLLHINHETRSLALRHYEPAFSWKLPPRLAGPETGVTPSSRPTSARVWFNFRLDALLLLGELEPYDQYGFNSPMVYFLRREDTRRVRHVACAFEELHMSLYESDQVFGSLFHVIDMFPAARRLLVTTTPQDVEVRQMVLPARENVVQKLWSAFMSGTTCVTGGLRDRQILMIRESELAGFVRDCGDEDG